MLLSIDKMHMNTHVKVLDLLKYTFEYIFSAFKTNSVSEAPLDLLYSVVSLLLISLLNQSFLPSH